MRRVSTISSYVTTYANDYQPICIRSKRRNEKEPGKPVVNLWDIEEPRVHRAPNCTCHRKPSDSEKVKCDVDAWTYLKDVHTEYSGKYCFDFDLPATIPDKTRPGMMKLLKTFIEEAKNDELKMKQAEEQEFPCAARWWNKDLAYDNDLQCKLGELYRTRQGITLLKKRPAAFGGY